LNTKADALYAITAALRNADRGEKEKSLNEIENIYKEIAEEEKKLCEDFMSISLETIGNEHLINNKKEEVE